MPSNRFPQTSLSSKLNGLAATFVQLTIFHMRELAGNRRELVIRAYSASDAAVLAASALGISIDQARDTSLFPIMEVNYGDEFAAGGPRSVIAVF